MDKAFENILERIDSYIEDAKSEGDFSYIKPFEIAKIAVQEVAEEYNDGWILCSDRLPEEHETMFAKLKGTDKWDSAMPEKISDDVNVTVEFEDGTRKTMTLHTNDGKWNTNNRIVKFNVIAWQPLPEPYQQDGGGWAGSHEIKVQKKGGGETRRQEKRG